MGPGLMGTIFKGKVSKDTVSKDTVSKDTVFKDMALRLAPPIRFPPTRPRLRIGLREPNLPPKPRPLSKTRRARCLPTPMPA